MKKPLRGAVWIATAACMLIGSISSTQAERVQIIDAVTRKPLSNVWVVTKWEGDFPGIVHAQTSCVDMYITGSDAEGFARLPLLSFSLLALTSLNLHRVISFYKFGYLPNGVDGGFPPIPTVIPMQATPDLPRNRLTELAMATELSKCGRSRDYFAMRIPMLDYIVTQAESLDTSTNNDGRRKLAIRRALDSVLWGETVAKAKFESASERYRRGQ